MMHINMQFLTWFFVRGAPQIDFLTDEGRPDFLPILQRFLLCKMTLLYIKSGGDVEIQLSCHGRV